MKSFGMLNLAKASLGWGSVNLCSLKIYNVCNLALDSFLNVRVVSHLVLFHASFLEANYSGDLRLTCSTKKTAKQLQRDFNESSRAF